MSRKHTLMLLGVLIVLSPFVGLPYSFLMVILPILGLWVGYLGFRIRRKIPIEEAAFRVGEHNEEASLV